MKVLHIISGKDSGGAKTHVLSLLQHPDISDNIHLVCLGTGALAQGADAAGISCEVTGEPFFRQVNQVSRILHGQHFDVIHCHGTRANLLGALLKHKNGPWTVSTVHSDHLLDYLGRPLVGTVLTALDSYALRRMDALECVSEGMAMLYRRRGYAFGRIYSNFNGREFYAEPAKATSDGTVWIGTLARLDKVKDIPTLIRGFALAAKNNSALRLRIAGSGKQEKELRSLAKQMGIDRLVEFTGWADDTEAFYRSIDIYAVTSLSETCPYAVTDAARFALPVVATAVGGLPELIENEISGLLIPVGDAERLKDALLRLSSDCRLRLRLGEEFQRKVQADFSLNGMAEKQNAIYESVLQNQRRGVIVAGAYGQDNLGDEAILKGIVSQLREVNAEEPILVVSRNPEQTGRAVGCTAVHPMRFLRLAREMKSAKLFISGGGNLFQDFTSSRSLNYYLWQLKTAGKAGCRVVVYGAGVGPLSWGGLRKTRKALERYADDIVLRESTSVRMLENDKARQMADPALLLVPAVGIEVPEEPYVTLCLRKWPHQAELRERLVAEMHAVASERGEKLVILPLHKKDENLRFSYADIIYLPCPDTPEEALTILARGSLTVSMRLHGVVLSAGAGIPTLGIDCDGRIAAFAEDAGIPCLSADAALKENGLRQYLNQGERLICSRTADLKARLRVGIDVLKKELD